MSFPDLISLDPKIAGGVPANWLRQIELDVKYEGYLKREERHIQRFRKMEHLAIPEAMDWDMVPGLSSEAREKLKVIRPVSVGQASRVPGVRSSDVAIILVQMDRR